MCHIDHRAFFALAIQILHLQRTKILPAGLLQLPINHGHRMAQRIAKQDIVAIGTKRFLTVSRTCGIRQPERVPAMHNKTADIIVIVRHPIISRQTHQRQLIFPGRPSQLRLSQIGQNIIPIIRHCLHLKPGIHRQTVHIPHLQSIVRMLVAQSVEFRHIKKRIDNHGRPRTRISVARIGKRRAQRALNMRRKRVLAYPMNLASLIRHQIQFPIGLQIQSIGHV